MKALIVGADKVTPIRQELARHAAYAQITETEHWSGRKVGDEKRTIPSGTALVVVICDRINHKLLRSVKAQARKLDVPLLYSRHSLIEVRDKLGCIHAAA